jgi:dihydrofolate reductase
MKLIIIAALNNNRVIGKNGKIPWHIPEDMQRFKMLTTGHTVLMGRKTFESIGSALPQRRNIVLSRSGSRDHFPGNPEVHPSIEAALAHLHIDETVFIIGGGEIYRQFLHRADELLLTVVENDENGDIFFPDYAPLIGSRFTAAGVEHHTGYAFHTYKRID